MIQLHSDCLVFEVSGGDKIPCSVEKLTIEVLSDSLDHLDPDVVRQAATAVLHYFKEDLGRENVTLDEFTSALEHVLTGLGYEVRASANSPELEPADGTAVAVSSPPAAAEPAKNVVEFDLDALANSLGDGMELGFYPRLRTELHSLLAGTPEVVRFRGLRRCAKRLARTRRWCPRSLRISDEIVGFLRDCWDAERPRMDCALLVNGTD